jgi:hypothetical protein
VYRLLVGKPEGKRPLGRPRHRWIDNIKMDLLEIGLSVVDCSTCHFISMMDFDSSVSPYQAFNSNTFFIIV